AHAELCLQHGDDELSWRVVVVQQDDLMQARPLCRGLHLGARLDEDIAHDAALLPVSRTGELLGPILACPALQLEGRWGGENGFGDVSLPLRRDGASVAWPVDGLGLESRGNGWLHQSIPSQEASMTFRSAILSIAFAAGTLALATAAYADMSADEQKIRELDQKWVAAVQARDAVASAAFYAEDGALLAANAPIAKGGPAVLAAWQGLMGMKNINLTFAPTEIVVSQSGDMAYDIGTYALSFEGNSGPV